MASHLIFMIQRILLFEYLLFILTRWHVKKKPKYRLPFLILALFRKQYAVGCKLRTKSKVGAEHANSHTYKLCLEPLKTRIYLKYTGTLYKT
jgi:hypothetical protein